jgi:hypothetical protein
MFCKCNDIMELQFVCENCGIRKPIDNIYLSLLSINELVELKSTFFELYKNVDTMLFFKMKGN